MSIQHVAVIVEGVAGSLTKGGATIADLRQGLLKLQDVPGEARLTIKQPSFSFQQNLIAEWESGVDDHSAT